MNCRTVGLVFFAAIFAAFSLSTTTHAQTTPFAKGQVADRIRKVEDGVDQFRKYLENRGRRRQEPGGIGAEQRSDSAPTAFKFSEHRSSRKPSQAIKRRSRRCHGRSESHHKPPAAQVRCNLELSGDKGANGAGHGQRAPG